MLRTNLIHLPSSIIHPNDIFHHTSSFLHLNDKYFKEGDTKREVLTEFNSNNTKRLNLEETKEKIASLTYIQNELNGIPNLV